MRRKHKQESSKSATSSSATKGPAITSSLEAQVSIKRPSHTQSGLTAISDSLLRTNTQNLKNKETESTDSHTVAGKPPTQWSTGSIPTQTKINTNKTEGIKTTASKIQITFS